MAYLFEVLIEELKNYDIKPILDLADCDCVKTDLIMYISKIDTKIDIQYWNEIYQEYHFFCESYKIISGLTPSKIMKIILSIFLNNYTNTNTNTNTSANSSSLASSANLANLVNLANLANLANLSDTNDYWKPVKCIRVKYLYGHITISLTQEYLNYTGLNQFIFNPDMFEYLESFDDVDVDVDIDEKYYFENSHDFEIFYKL